MKNVWKCFAILFFAGAHAGQLTVSMQVTTVLGAMEGGRHSYNDIKRIQKSINNFNYVLSSINYFNRFHELPQAAHRELVIEDYIFQLSEREDVTTGFPKVLLTIWPSEKTSWKVIDAHQFCHNQSGDFSQQKISSQLDTALFQARQRIKFYGLCTFIGAGFLIWEIAKRRSKLPFTSNDDIARDYYE